MSDNERGAGGDEVGLPRATVNKLISGDFNLASVLHILSVALFTGYIPLPLIASRGADIISHTFFDENKNRVSWSR